jgi:DNA-binding NarL/FixJ family response regulator
MPPREFSCSATSKGTKISTPRWRRVRWVTCSNTSLSSREREIVRLLVLGEANKEIANRLGITEQTVKSHVKNILAKLQVRDRTEAVTVALRRGIVHLPEI